MPPNPKRRATEPVTDEAVLQADDPRPQRVAQLPANSTGARRTLKKVEEHIPTSVFDTEADQEMQAEYGVTGAEYKPAFLYVERVPGAGQLLEVKQGTVIVGRASVSDLRLQHPSISRRHTQFKRVGEQFFVKDLGSQNGTFVNKQRKQANNIRIADTPQHFAAQCLELADSPDQRRQVSQDAWQMVNDNFSWEHVARCFEQIMYSGPRMTQVK